MNNQIRETLAPLYPEVGPRPQPPGVAIPRVPLRGHLQNPLTGDGVPGVQPWPRPREQRVRSRV